MTERAFESAMLRKSNKSLEQMCIQLRTHALESGFKPIAEVAVRLQVSIGNSSEPVQMRAVFRELVRLCRSARPVMSLVQL